MIKLIYSLLFVVLANLSWTQTFNWHPDNQPATNRAYLNLGYDFGITTQLGYTRQLTTETPIQLSADFAFPMGKNVLDDFKLRIGAQRPLLTKNNWTVATGLRVITRRQSTRFVQMINIGADLFLTAGYYKPKWYLAVEIGTDQALLTHLNHTDLLRANYPNMANGWFGFTAGHLYYGLQTGRTVGTNWELTLKAGANRAHFKHQNPLLPLYFQVGIIRKLN